MHASDNHHATPNLTVDSILKDACGRPPPPDLIPTEESMQQSERTQRECYELVQSELRLVLPEEMARYGGQHDLVHHNANRGTRALGAHLPELKKRFTEEEIRLAFLVPVYAAALVYTARRVERVERSPTPLDDLLPKMWATRDMLFSQLATAVKFKLLEGAVLVPIRKGYGVLDGAQDVTDLCAVYRDNEETLAGRTFVTEEFLVAAERLSAQVRLHIIPTGGTANEPATSEICSLKLALDERDRVWTLLVRAHRMGQKMAGAVWGASARRKYPTLRAVNRQRKAAQTPEVPETQVNAPAAAPVSDVARAG